MKTTKILINSLIIDPKLTAIRHINQVFVSRYRQAYREGANMPFMIVEEGTNRVVSGNHRLTALLKEYGEDHEIMVEMREYVSEAEVLKDFAKENATHGSPMDDFTRRKLTTAMAEAGVSVNEIASIFNVSVRRVESYGDGIVRVELKSGGIEDKPVKRGFETENIISEAQYVEHEKKDRGFPLASQVGQLLRWLNNGHIPYTESNKAILKELREAIDQYFKLEKKKRVLEKV